VNWAPGALIARRKDWPTPIANVTRRGAGWPDRSRQPWPACFNHERFPGHDWSALRRHPLDKAEVRGPLLRRDRVARVAALFSYAIHVRVVRMDGVVVC